MRNVSTPSNYSTGPVRNLRPAINTSGLRIPQKGDGKRFDSISITLWQVIRTMSHVLIEQNHVRSRRKRVSRSLSPRRRLQLLMVILTLLISVCGVVWLQRQVPFSNGFSHNHLGFGLVPFVDTQTQQINAVSSASDPTLPAANPITSDATVHTPRVQFSNNLMYHARNEPGPLVDSPEFDIEDEYLFSLVNDFDHDRFTEDYFEYEHGQKDIIVKNRLRKHIDFWRDIGANQYILDTILYGYKIPFYSLPPRSVSNNNQSALNESVFVREAISDLLDKGLIQKCDYIPTVINPLSVSIKK